MITVDNFPVLLAFLNFKKRNDIYSKTFANEVVLKVNLAKKILIYPENKGLKIHERQTCNFSSNENFVVFECVHRLLEKGYHPESIELEPKWKVGHGASGGRADILVKDRNQKPLLIIECKTTGSEYSKALKYTLLDGGQLFSYAQQIPATEFLCLYASNFTDKNKLNRDYFVIRHKDNPIVLAQDNQAKSFNDAQSVEERFNVWKETYQLEPLTLVIFEEANLAYVIGKDKYTLADLNPISHSDAQDKTNTGKYHHFRTILRKHNVARRENAFEVLVNLFLCKLVDESEHPQNLKFYWKGIAYDSYFDLVDRLQSLYKTGMERFLEQEITYISNNEIDEAFWAVGNNRNATKQKIKAIFTQLKFYKGLDFDFIKVHNKELFDKNAKILIEIVQMWQDSRLKTDEQNQFLGDMFEYFLDNGIKQSEGQFFTPIPVCRFILRALPLDDLIKDSKDVPKMIDYACGAGHFLNEYAAQIRPSVLKHKPEALKEYYANIIGIEKEDRLAKVAKVSAFMYGQDEIHVIDADALAPHNEVKQASFDVLVANPPFAVEGFLETLTKAQRADYDLLDTVSDVVSNRNIQCFFLERAKQLLAPKGMTGIIVPSSVLSNSDATHVAAREQLLQYFDLVSLVELGSGTFGKTGTNTVVLFLRRKHKQPTEAEHYKNRVDDWFNGDEEAGVYNDAFLIQRYCDHIEVDFSAYQSLLMGEPSIELLATALFVDYEKAFSQLSEIKNLKKQRLFKSKTQAEKEIELKRRFLLYLRAIEKDKLYYFVLAFNNPQKVLVIKSPSDNKKQKAFLGYEWSSAKGNEGIKLTVDAEGQHVTPLYDPVSRDNAEKLSYWIGQNFLGNEINLTGLEDLASTLNLVDMLDFSRMEFNKAVSLLPKKKIEIETKWDLVKLGEVCNILIGGTPSRKIQKYFTGSNLWVSISEMNGQIITDTKEKITGEGVKNSNVKLIPKGTTLLSFKLSIGKTAIAGDDLYTNEAIAGLIPNNTDLLDFYLYQIFTAKLIDLENTGLKAFGKSLNSKFLREDVKIPLPDKPTQQLIVSECEQIDNEVTVAKQSIYDAKLKVENKLIKLSSQNYTEKKISDISFINPSKSELKNVDENILISFIGMASVSNDGFIEQKQDRKLKDVRKGSYTYFRENDIIIAKITPCMENGKCALAKSLTNQLAMGSSEFHVIRCNETVLSEYIFALINRERMRKEAEKNMTGSSGHRRVPASFYENYKIPVPDLKTQQTLVSEIEKLEQKIQTAQAIINTAAAKKQDILKKYL